MSRSPITSGDTVVLAGRVLDPETGSYTGPSAIIIRQGKIVAVEPQRTFNAAGFAGVIDLRAYTLLPGLIDGHVHLAIRGSPRANALADLNAGFTTVVDLGSFSNRLLKVRDSINAGLIPGPRVIAAGRWVGTKGGICEFNGIGVAGGPEAFRARVAENVTDGADLIKVCISGWARAAYDRPESYEISDSALSAVVAEAHARGKRVVAHDISAGGVRAALRFGVDGLAHTAIIDDSLAGAVARRGVFMISTLASLTAGDSSEVPAALRKAILTARRSGIPLVFGTDAGVIPHGDNAAEMIALRNAGLTGAEIIRMATVNAARAFGLADSVGRIRPGMNADLIAVAGDPVADVSVLTKVEWVMLRGRVVHSSAPLATQ